MTVIYLYMVVLPQQRFCFPSPFSFPCKSFHVEEEEEDKIRDKKEK